MSRMVSSGNNLLHSAPVRVISLVCTALLLVLVTACLAEPTPTPLPQATALPSPSANLTITPSVTPPPTRTPTPTPVPDLLPPEPVLDLVGTDSTTQTITLEWTAPSDNWGTPKDFDLRAADAPITQATWNEATQLEDEPQPKAAGTRQTYIAAGLKPNTQYYFALRTRDAAGNWSDVSNTISEATYSTREFRVSQPDPTLVGGKFQGFGAEWDPFYWTDFNTQRGADEAGWALTTARIKELGLPLMRMMMDLYWVQKSPALDQWTWDDPNFKALLRQLDFAQANNIDVILTDWGWVVNPALRGSAFYKPDDERYAQGIADYLHELIDVRGYTAIKYLVVINEPDTKINSLFTMDQYVALYRNLDKALRENGLRDKIKLMGPDISHNDKVFAELVSRLHDIIDVYDFHRYTPPSETSNIGITEVQDATWSKLDGRRTDVLAADPKGQTKQILVTELAPNYRQAETYAYALDTADLGTTLLSTRLNGASVWNLQDVHYFENPKIFDYGMWHFADRGWALKPWAQVYALLVKYAPRGSVQAAVNKTPPAVPPLGPYRSAAVKRSDGGWSIFLVNRSKESIRANVLLPAKSKHPFSVYQIDSTTFAQNSELLSVPPVETISVSGPLRVTVPGESFVVLAEEMPNIPSPAKGH